MIQRTISQLNQEIQNINSKIQDISQINQSYQHKEQTYNSVKEALEFIFSHSFQPKQQIPEAILTLGKTGWGKSTTINYLHGNKLSVLENGKLSITDNCSVITPIGNGRGSTTLFPISCRTSFGTVYDLPGDQETRGVSVEIINCISKKNMGKILKNIKLMLMIPYSTFTDEGSYGSGLKDILASNDKFLGGINKYKNNIIIVITSASRRKVALKEVIKNINFCLNHTDKKLADYEELLQNVIEKGRVRLFPKPNQDTDDGAYQIPNGEQWQIHKRTAIVQLIRSIESRKCHEDQFSVPNNAKIKQILRKMLIVIVQKIKYQISQCLIPTTIAGVQLKFYQQFLDTLRSSQKISLKKFTQLLSTNEYFKVPSLKEYQKYLDFIQEFLLQNGDEEIMDSWCSKNFQQKISDNIKICQQLNAQKGGNFRKKTKHQSLKVEPSSKKFDQIQQQFKNLQQHNRDLQQLQLDKNNNQSSLYIDQSIKVYEQTIQEPYEQDEHYVEYQSRQTTEKVPNCLQRMKKVKKYRVKHRIEKQKYIQAVQKTKKSKFLWTFIDVPYTDYQQRQRQKLIPYTEEYQQQQPYMTITYVDQKKTIQVPVTKTRKRTLYRPKDVYKQQLTRTLNHQKYKQEKQFKQKLISQSEQKIERLIVHSEKGDISKFDIPLDALQARNQIQESYYELLRKWCVAEYESFAFCHPRRVLDVAKLKI